MDNNRWLNCCIVCDLSHSRLCGMHFGAVTRCEANTVRRGDDADDCDNEIFHKFHIQLSSSMPRLIKSSLQTSARDDWRWWHSSFSFTHMLEFMNWVGKDQSQKVKKCICSLSRWILKNIVENYKMIFKGARIPGNSVVSVFNIN